MKKRKLVISTSMLKLVEHELTLRSLLHRTVVDRVRVGASRAAERTLVEHEDGTRRLVALVLS